MVRYTFKLKKAYAPDLTCENSKDNLYGGINLLYSIRRIKSFKLLNREIPYSSKLLGKKTFLRPYKKYWDKHKYRLQHPYWGKVKHPLTRMWMIPLNNFPLTGNKPKIIPEVALTHFTVKILGKKFRSKDITDHLFKQHNKFSITNI